MPKNVTELAFLEKNRDKIQRDAKRALDLYYGAVRDGNVDDILMELQISYSELSRKEHYLDHGIIIIEGIGDEGAWASHVMMTPDQLMAHTDYLWTNAHYREWRARLIDIHTRNQPDGNMNTDDTPGTTRAVPYGDFQLVELPEPVAGSTSPQAASAHASPAAASPTVSAHSGTAASPDVPAPSDNASPRATPPPSDDTTDSAAPAHADAGAPPAAGNECEAPVVAAHPRLPLLGFVIPEHTRKYIKYNLAQIKRRPTKAQIRWSSPSRHGYDICYCRLDQPTDRFPGAKGFYRVACPFRIYEEHGTHPDPRWVGWEPHNRFDYHERMRLMHSRNRIIKEQLTYGHPVQFRCWGFCLHPWVCDGDCCIFEPIVCLSSLRRGDIVF